MEGCCLEKAWVLSFDCPIFSKHLFCCRNPSDTHPQSDPADLPSETPLCSYPHSDGWGAVGSETDPVTGSVTRARGCWRPSRRRRCVG